MSQIHIPVSPGELVDKLTILRLKSEHIRDEGKLANVRRELTALQKIADAELRPSENLDRLWSQLLEVNRDLWTIEDDIRSFESKSDFGPGFIALARSVYVTNDERAAIKRRINLLMDSPLIEEKSYNSGDPDT